MTTNESKLYKYAVFTHYLFNKPKMYSLKYKHLSWTFFDKLFRTNEWVSVNEKGNASIDSDAFFTESKDEIQSFMKWNIDKDNNDLN